MILGETPPKLGVILAKIGTDGGATSLSVADGAGYVVLTEEVVSAGECDTSCYTTIGKRGCVTPGESSTSHQGLWFILAQVGAIFYLLLLCKEQSCS